MKHGLKALFAVAVFVATTSNAATIDLHYTVPLTDINDRCGNQYTICWAFEFDAVNLDLTADTIRVFVEFPGPFRLRWDDDGISTCCAIVASELVDGYFWDSTGTDIAPVNSWRGGGLTFFDVEGDLLVNNMYWEQALSGSLGNSTLWEPAYQDFTNDGFSFSGLMFQIGPFWCGSFPCTLQHAPLIDRFSLALASGVFTVIRPVPEPGSLALLGLGLLGLGMSRRKA